MHDYYVVMVSALLHTGYLDSTNAVGDNQRRYKQWRHGNTHDKKTPNSSSNLI